MQVIHIQTQIQTIMKGTYQPNDTIELSAIAKNYNGGQNKEFKTHQIQLSKLAAFLKKYNFSMITWEGGLREEQNFLKSIGFTGDNDKAGLTMQEAHDRLVKLDINHVIIPSRSHTKDHHRFHVIIFFDVPVYSADTYKRVAKQIVEEILPESDDSVTDAARFIYGSPDNANAIVYLDGKNYDISDEDGLWNVDLKIKDKDGAARQAHEFGEKTPIYCPFHKDSKPSAFIDFSEKSDNYYIHCSSCGQTYWMFKDVSYLERACQDYYSYGTEIWDFGMVNGEFFYDKIGQKKFHVLTNTENEPEKSEALRYLIKQHHIRHLGRVDFVSDMEAEESHYNVNLGLGIITASHAAIPIDIQDNAFVETYLKDRFGQYLQFIKEWLAVYCYTNYRKLPTLIFASERGNGKSSFVEIIADIFSTLSFQWGGSEDSFTYEVEKKLLIVDENQSDKVSQYKTLKKYTGQKYATVKKKFKDPYQVKNNMSIIIMSNDAIPLFVSRGELPTDTKNNQFFIYEFPALTGSIDPELQEKMLARLGHYIRTELKTVFDGLNMSGFRYSIDVPITDAEKELFTANTSDLESEVDMLVNKLIDQFHTDLFPTDEPWYPFIEKGYLPVQWIKNYTSGQKHYNQMIKAMRRQRLLVGETARFQSDGKRLFCLTMTDKLVQMLGTPNKPKVVGVVSDVACTLFNQGA